MNIKYKVTDVNLDVGLITLDIELAPGINKIVDINLFSIATSNDSTVGELIALINSQVSTIYKSYFPPEPPKPHAANELLGRIITVDV